MPFPPSDKSMAGVLKDTRERLDLVERRLAVGGTGGSGGSGGSTPPYDAVAGVVVPFSGATAPAGWLLCDGAAVSRSAYGTLFTAIGTTYGAGDGSTTFNLPDYRGRTLVGRDPAQTEFDVLGEKGGEKSVALSDPNMSPNTYRDNNKTGGTQGWITAAASGNRWFGTGPNEGIASGVPHNNLQPYAVANYIISTGSGVGGGGSNVPSLPDPKTAYTTNTNEHVDFTGPAGGWVDVPGCSITYDLPNPAWVAVDYGIQMSTPNAAIYGMIGVAARGALVLPPETDQISGVAVRYGLAPFSLGPSNINQRGEKLLLLPKGSTTLQFQIRRSGTGATPTGDYPVLHAIPLSWVGAPGATQNMTRGTTAQRDAVYGVPSNAADQAALANKVVEWFNTAKGYTEVYYATTGTAGLTAKGLATGFPSGWYPAAGSLIWGTCTVLNAQSVATGEVRVNMQTGDLVGGMTTGNNVMVVPVGGIYEVIAHLYRWAPAQGTYRAAIAFDVNAGTLYANGTTSGAWDIASVPRRSRIAAGVQIGLKTAGDAGDTLQGQSWPALEVRYVGPPLVNG